MFTIDISGEPIPQMRPRFARMGNAVCTYDAQKKLKEGYKWQIKSQYREDPIPGPVYLDVTFYMPVPKSTSGIKKRQMVNGVLHHIKRPDIDNLQKFLLDCINKLVIEDDSQVVELRARKVYSGRPGTLIRITCLNDMENHDVGHT